MVDRFRLRRFSLLVYFPYCVCFDTKAYVEELGSRLPSESEKAAANQLRQILAAHATGHANLRVLDEHANQPTEIRLSPALQEIAACTF